MKRIVILLGCMLITAIGFAQDQAQAYIKEAQDFLTKKDYQQALLSLQDATNEINRLIGEQAAAALPDEINGLKADGPASSNSGAMGMMGGGIAISRSYTNPSNSMNTAELNIIANSPMIATFSMYLTNPAMMGNEYKGVKVGTQRAILKSETNDTYDNSGNSVKIRNTELTIPVDQTLITITLKGFATEQEELAFASKLDLEKLKTALGQ